MLGLSLLTVGLFAVGTGFSAARSQDVTIDGDHGKLSAVIQRPDGKTSYPLVIIMHGFMGNKERPLLTKLADDLEKTALPLFVSILTVMGRAKGDSKI